ncbi:hypothetical protein PYW07_003719 [Mythimna separata]|uniref:CCHC-type domain-containing protein n=2 Tax=Mythimna separata TaxID=271217 RepID=A0AAD7YPN6_MYTSE|nr:hypothetical protein PYW07_003719 [Mythimna separata]
MENSPFSRDRVNLSASPAKTTPQTQAQTDLTMEVVSTSEIQRWMSTIEQYLSEICTIASDGKLNSEQKLKISTLCRKVGNGTSEMAVQYQSLKQKAIQARILNEDLKQKCNLTDHILDLTKTIKDSSTASFADMVKKGSNDFVRPKNLNSVAIYPNNNLKSSDETKVLVQQMIRPEQEKLHIRGVRRTKNGGVIISTETKDDAEKIKHAIQQSASGLTADEPRKRKPRIVVVGVPSSLTETEVFRYIYEQNVAEKFPTISMESFMTLIKLSHKSGKKDSQTCNYVVEVPANIRKALISQSRIFINWTSCPVRDFTLVTRCFKCHQYGHAAKTCREVNSTCGHCGETGHSMSECTKKADSPKCATCSRFKKPANHKSGDAECPARKMAELRYINSIDYEGA